MPVCVCGSYFVCSMGGSLAEKLIRVFSLYSENSELTCFLLEHFWPWDGIVGRLCLAGDDWRKVDVFELFENFLNCHL